MSACKPKIASTVQTLDDLAGLAGDGACVGDADAKVAANAVVEGAEPYRSYALETLKAVPLPVQEHAFKGIKIAILPDISQKCKFDPNAKEYETHSCRNDDDATIYIKQSEPAIRVSVTRQMAYVFADVVMSSPARFFGAANADFRMRLGASFLQDLAAMSDADHNLLTQFEELVPKDALSLDSTVEKRIKALAKLEFPATVNFLDEVKSAKHLNIFLDKVFSETFDSMFCNDKSRTAFAEDGRFERTGKAFKPAYDKIMEAARKNQEQEAATMGLALDGPQTWADGPGTSTWPDFSTWGAASRSPLVVMPGDNNQFTATGTPGLYNATSVNGRLPDNGTFAWNQQPFYDGRAAADQLSGQVPRGIQQNATGMAVPVFTSADTPTAIQNRDDYLNAMSRMTTNDPTLKGANGQAGVPNYKMFPNGIMGVLDRPDYAIGADGKPTNQVSDQGWKDANNRPFVEQYTGYQGGGYYRHISSGMYEWVDKQGNPDPNASLARLNPTTGKWEYANANYTSYLGSADYVTANRAKITDDMLRRKDGTVGSTLSSAAYGNQPWLTDWAAVNAANAAWNKRNPAAAPAPGATAGAPISPAGTVGGGGAVTPFVSPF
jgi:hypothetical protein